MSRRDRREAELAREQQVARTRADLAATRAELVDTRSRLEGAQMQLTALRDEVGGLREHVAKLDATVGGMQEWLQSISQRTDRTAGALEHLQADQERDRDGFSRALARVERRVPDATALYGPGGFALQRFDVGLGGEVLGFRNGGADRKRGVYVGFEDFFRGSEEQIRERQRAYLPLLRAHAPVLDAGCGRGEMLELLCAEGIEAAGIDIDEAMIERCRAKGLERVEVADAVTYVEAAEPGALGAVFAAQVIEHLPYPELLRLLRAARRAITAGGLLIVETVNPHVPQALKHFWVDPTHQHPLFPEVVLSLCLLTGFAEAYIWYPQGSGDPDLDRGEQPDYAVVAQIPPR